jgi:hypothetical protein
MRNMEEHGAIVRMYYVAPPLSSLLATCVVF